MFRFGRLRYTLEYLKNNSDSSFFVATLKQWHSFPDSIRHSSRALSEEILQFWWFWPTSCLPLVFLRYHVSTSLCVVRNIWVTHTMNVLMSVASKIGVLRWKERSQQKSQSCSFIFLSLCLHWDYRYCDSSFQCKRFRWRQQERSHNASSFIAPHFYSSSWIDSTDIIIITPNVNDTFKGGWGG